MANGISCAFFAGKNLIYGQKEKNLFKEGIGGIQTVRTVDSAAKSGLINIPHAPIFSKITAYLKKILYPLIILSGVYNTIKSEDRIKTGFEQAGGISFMYAFETCYEKLINPLEKNLLNNPNIKNNKLLKTGIYILKGLGFVCASLGGYSTGSKLANTAVSKYRKINADKKENETYVNIFDDVALI